MNAQGSYPLRMPSRRGRSRLKTCLNANVISLYGSIGAALLDISLTGAKLQIISKRRVAEGLRPRERVVISWVSFEVMGSVVWTHSDLFGVRFDEFVPPKVLIATRDLSDEVMAQGGRPAVMQDQVRRAVRDWVNGR
ncbi:MAG: PilZ domain-containing protein [Novosphingobium sp.]|jgi:hypothetical protein|nr:PilZ domain-containing protein [Novosphingobium sp.]